MKNRLLTGLLAALVGGINATVETEQLAATLAQTGIEFSADQKNKRSLATEKNVRKQLYWLDKNNPLFYKLDSFQKDSDYYILVLTEHIKVLEGKIALGQDGRNSKGMRTAEVEAALSAVSALSACFWYGMSRLPMGLDPKQFSELYRKAESQKAINGAVVFAIISGLCAVAAKNQLSKVSRYKERIGERLERDKRILATLEKEKAAKESSKLNGVTPQAVEKVIGAVLGAIDSMIKPVCASA